jgi:hypothetical protein
MEAHLGQHRVSAVQQLGEVFERIPGVEETIETPPGRVSSRLKWAVAP